MGLLDRYRRFEDVPADEVHRDLQSRRDRERARARRQTTELDLSRTSSPVLPNTEVVNAAIAVARTCVNVDPDPRAAETRTAIADHHGVALEQVAIGNGAAELIEAAARTLLEPDDEILTSWPSYPLYTGLARHARARTVTVPLEEGGHDIHALLAAMTPRTRVVTLCNPNDPTGAYLPVDRLASLLDALPERVHLLLDEALVHFQTVQPIDAALEALERYPNLLIFRSFSKIYGLAGLRGGYAVGAPGRAELLDALSPSLGVNAVTQTAMAYALQHGGADVEARRATIATERRRLLAGLEDLEVTATRSEANFVWLRAGELRAPELSQLMARSGVHVSSGEAVFGDREHVRIAIRDDEATARVLDALADAGRART